MRSVSFTLLLVASVGFVAAAHADTIDDFVLTGEGHSITFSLPSVLSAVNFPLLNFVDTGNFAGMVDGVGGYTMSARFAVPFQAGYSGFELFVSPSVSGGSSQSGNQTEFDLVSGFLVSPSGSSIVSLPTYPYSETIDYFTLKPGTYSECSPDPSSPGPSSAPCYGAQPFTVTITPEAPASVTPEPSSLMLLGTGVLGALGAARRRSLRRGVGL